MDAHKTVSAPAKADESRYPNTEKNARRISNASGVSCADGRVFHIFVIYFTCLKYKTKIWGNIICSM